MLYIGILILSIFNFLVTLYTKRIENTPRSILYILFSLCLLIRSRTKYEKLRIAASILIILFALVMFYTDWFLPL